MIDFVACVGARGAHFATRVALRAAGSMMRPINSRKQWAPRVLRVRVAGACRVAACENPLGRVVANGSQRMLGGRGLS